MGLKCHIQVSFLCLNIPVRRVLSKRRTRCRKMAQKVIILFSALLLFLERRVKNIWHSVINLLMEQQIL